MESLVFRRGRWIRVQLPFSDPLLTESHRRFVAAVAATWISKGHSQQAAEAAAEKVLYEALYPGLVGMGDSPLKQDPSGTT